MIIKPRVRGFMCITAHPEGCAANVRRQIDYVRSQGVLDSTHETAVAKRVLVIGASTGYGLASRIVSAAGCGAATLGVFFEKEGNETKPGSAGWYNSAAFHNWAENEGLYAKSLNTDAFSDDAKEKVIATIKEDLGQVDLVVYSLAAPRRTHPRTGEVFNSTLKSIGKSVTLRGVNTDKEIIQEMNVEPASEDEIASTVAVMGGEDWLFWMEALKNAGVLAEGAKTTAYTYLGAELTWDIYWNGTIGEAKKDLDTKAKLINSLLADLKGEARVAVLKAVVTQASSAIPIMPLYLALLFKVMKEAGTHEDCIEQVDLLFRESLYGAKPRIDADGRWRADYKELEPAVQEAVKNSWSAVTSENLHEITDFSGYQRNFLQLFGFEMEGVDYEVETNPVVYMPLIS